MGMDLVPGRPTSRLARDGLAVNTATWMALGELLDQLRCDLSEMSVFNQGDRIRAATCRAWAKAIRAALPKIRRLTVKRPRYPVFPVHLYLEGHENEAIKCFTPATRTAVRRHGYRVAPLDRDEIAELKAFCVFFETAGGFRQY